MRAVDAEFEGKVTAKEGSIGGFTITNNTLTSGSGSSYVRISGATGYTPILIGGTTWDGASFAVSTTGTLKSKDGTFTTGSYSGSSYGYGSFTSGSYTGSLYSSSGRLGGSNFSSENTTTVFAGTVRAGGLKTKYIDLDGGYIIGEYNPGLGSYTKARLKIGKWEIENSDIRLKENIKELDYSFNKYIYEMPLIKYNYKGDKSKNPQVGVNANYLMKILPEDMAKSFLHQDKITGLYGANYELLTPYLVKVVQEQNERIKKLEERLNG